MGEARIIRILYDYMKKDRAGIHILSAVLILFYLVRPKRGYAAAFSCLMVAATMADSTEPPIKKKKAVSKLPPDA